MEEENKEILAEPEPETQKKTRYVKGKYIRKTERQLTDEEIASRQVNINKAREAKLLRQRKEINERMVKQQIADKIEKNISELEQKRTEKLEKKKKLLKQLKPERIDSIVDDKVKLALKKYKRKKKEKLINKTLEQNREEIESLKKESSKLSGNIVRLNSTVEQISLSGGQRAYRISEQMKKV